jgi:hypothetical protein
MVGNRVIPTPDVTRLRRALVDPVLEQQLAQAADDEPVEAVLLLWLGRTGLWRRQSASVFCSSLRVTPAIPRLPSQSKPRTTVVLAARKWVYTEDT